MKLFRFLKDGAEHVGAKGEYGAVDLTAAGLAPTMEDIIVHWQEKKNAAAELLRGGSFPVPDEGGLIFLPATSPSKILCVGYNYKKHAAETHDTPPAEPAIFCKLLSCAAGHRENIPVPANFTQLDHEAELVLIIGRRTFNVTPEEAKSCIFGYTCGNDVSARDAQFKSSQWFLGKSLAKFAPTGPYIETADGLDVSDIAVECRVNGELHQSARTSDMTFSPEEVVSYVSRFMELLPGDQIFTGTPEGVILGRKECERCWLRAGDRMEVTIEGIGTLENTFIKE